MAGRLALGAEILLGLDQPAAKICDQWRLTATRAVKGFWRSVSQRASPSRSGGAPEGKRCSDPGTPGSTIAPGSRKFPLRMIRETRRLAGR